MEKEHWRFDRRWVGYSGCNNGVNYLTKVHRLNLPSAIEQEVGICTGVFAKDHIVYKK